MPRPYEDANTNPYSTQNNVYGGSASNGQVGSQTPESQTNAIIQQPTGAKGDPFSAFGSAAQQWSHLLPQYIGSVPPAPRDLVNSPIGAYPDIAILGNSPIGAKTPGLPYGETPTATGKHHAVSPVGPPPGGPNPDASLMNANTGTMTHDANGVPYSAQNPPPKPPGTEDPEIAADWYRKHAYMNPTFANITGADVSAYRTSGFQGDFATWYTSGKPTPAQTPSPIGPEPGTGWVDPTIGTPQYDRNGALIPGTGGGVGTGGAGGVSGRGTNTGGADPNAAGANGDLGSLLDYYKQLMGPMHAQEQEDYLRQLSTAGANSGAINSGAYGEAQSRGLADLINSENAGMYGNLFTGSESAKDRALQKALAEISGNYGVQAATIGASSAGAGAAASAAASKYNADLAYKQFQEELPYQDKWHGYNFQLGEDQLSGQQWQYLMNLMGGLTFPPSGVLPQLPQGGFF